MSDVFQSIAVTAMAGISPVGANIDQTCSSIRAGVSGYREHEYFWSEALYPEWQLDEPSKVAPVRSIDPMIDGPERLVELMRQALLQLVESGMLRRKELGRTALLASLPDVPEWGLDQGFLMEVAATLGVSFAALELDVSGHTGVHRLLARASTLLQTREVAQCIVMGADSYLSYDRLQALDASWQMKSAKNADGFIPGEAAVALLMRTPRDAGGSALLHVERVAFGDEPNTFSNELVSTAGGLSTAIRGVVRDGEQPGWVICDLNGVSARSFEWGTAKTRVGHPLGGAIKLVHPADCTGDVGAASGALLLACAAAAGRRGYAPASRALVWTAAEGPSRAAALATPVRG